MSAAREKLEAVRILLFDVDGVLTDNGLYLSADGGHFKRFDIRDGAGLKLARLAGFPVGLISGHRSEATRLRAEQLGLDACLTGVGDKVAAFEGILADHGLEPGEALYMGDDLVDLPVLRRAGYAVTVPGAPPEVAAAADHVTRARGGEGAVREAVEHVLRATGRYAAAVEKLE